MVATLTFDEQGCATTRNGTMIHRQALISNHTDHSTVVLPLARAGR